MDKRRLTIRAGNSLSLNIVVTQDMVLEVQIESDARVDVSIEHYSGTFTLQIVANHNSTGTFFLICAPVNATQLKLRTDVDAYGAVSIYGAYILKRDVSLLIDSYQLHQQPMGSSYVKLYGALFDAARVEYTGLIDIGLDGSGTNAHQINKNILFSPLASARSIPNIQAKTNHIRCGHGSAIGMLDTQHLWYLQSRGIEVSAARRLLMHGFFASLFDTLDPVSKHRLTTYVYELLTC